MGLGKGEGGRAGGVFYFFQAKSCFFESLPGRVGWRRTVGEVGPAGGLGGVQYWSSWPGQPESIIGRLSGKEVRGCENV